MVKKRGKKSNGWLFSIILTLIFAAVGVLLILQHEPVQSEYNSLLVRLGFSYRASSFICLTIVSVAVFLILKLTKFSKLQKVLIILSSGFFYYPSVYASFGITTFVWGAKVDYLEFSKQLNEALFGMLIPIFELGLVFLLIYLAARYIKLFFAAVIVFGGYLACAYFAAPLPLTGSEVAPLLALMVLFIALTFVAKPRGRNRFDQIFGRLETYKLIKNYTSIRSLCLIPVILSVPYAVFSAAHDLTSEISDANVVSSRFNEFEDDAVFLSVSPDMTALFSAYTPLFSDARHFENVELGDDVTRNDEQLAGVVSGSSSNNIYILIRQNACGNSIDPISIGNNWEKRDLALDNLPNMQLYKIKK